MLAVLILTSCASYKANIMFTVPDEAVLEQQAADIQRNYIIQKNDFLKLRVYTNKGELLIDPDFSLMKDIPAQNMQDRYIPDYLVDISGMARFPIIGLQRVEGLTLRQAELQLQQAYSQFYTDPFVILEYANKRIVVLGAPGGQVIPLINENMTLAEAIALAGGVSNDARANNIRILRDKQFFVVDFSTISGYQLGNMIMQPGDIIYIEPIRRPVSEGFRDYGMIVSVLTSLLTLVVVLVTL